MTEKKTIKVSAYYNQVTAFTFKELRVLWRDFEALALLFAMPVFFMVVMNLTLEGVFEAGKKGHPIEIVVVDLDHGPISGSIIEDLEGVQILKLIQIEGDLSKKKSRAEELVSRHKYIAALVFPPGFSEAVINSIEEGVTVRPVIMFIVDPATNQQMLEAVRTAAMGVVEKSVMRLRITASLERFYKDLTSTKGPFLEEQLSLMSELDLKGQFVEIEEILPSGAGKKRRPSAEEQNVPAYTIFGVFFIVLTIASSFNHEKTEGTFTRILTAPVPKAVILFGKLVPYLAVNLAQIFLMFLIGFVFFEIRPASLSAIFLVSITLALSANGLGLLVAAVAKTEAQINGLAILLAIALGALGGMMVPGFLMPGFMRNLSMFTPHAWALRGYHDVILLGMGLRDVLFECGILTLFAILFFMVALWRFRFSERQ